MKAREYRVSTDADRQLGPMASGPCHPSRDHSGASPPTQHPGGLPPRRSESNLQQTKEILRGNRNNRPDAVSGSIKPESIYPACPSGYCGYDFGVAGFSQPQRLFTKGRIRTRRVVQINMSPRDTVETVRGSRQSRGRTLGRVIMLA